MGQITSSIGLVSGIDTGSIINQLIAIESQPKQLLQTQISSNTAQKTAYSGILTQLGGLKTIGQAFERPSTFQATQAKSSNEDVLTATAAAGAAVGSFQFQVAQLVTSQQSITNGFADANTPVGAGNITISLGGGDLGSQTPLAQLNGGAGVRRGLFRITDREGKTAVIDTTAAVSLDDVVKKINTSLDVNVHAAVKGNHLELTDTGGTGTGSLVVQDLGDGQAAKDLGIVGAAAGPTLTGTNINALGAGTALASLNDGRGVRTAAGAADFTVNLSDGSAVTVTLGAAQTLGDAVKAINTAGGTKLAAAIDPNTNSLTLTDKTGGGGPFTITTQNGSKAAHDLGLDKAGAGGVIAGSSVLASLDSTLVSSLNGGSGLPLGKISVTDRSGASATVDLAGARSVQDVLDAINNQAGVSVSASLNTSGSGIQLQDRSGGAGNLVISDVNSTTAAALGIAGTFDTTKPVVAGANLHAQFVSENTQLSDYNGGKGVTPGSFTLTSSAGRTAQIDLSSGSFKTLGDVISAINAKNIGVTASVNANGNGLLLTDTDNGAAKLTVKDIGGTAAADLNIAGAAAANTIDGAFEKTIAVTATDTLATVQQKVQALGFAVAANLVNDGSGVNGEHLSLTAVNTGRNGRVVIDGGTTGIQAQTLVQAQDAAVFYGGGGGAQSLLVTSGTNQITGVIPGVTVQLNGVSDGPVTLNVSRDASSVVSQVQKFTDGFNAIVAKITDLTKFDTTTNTGGLLLGDSAVQTVQTELYVALQAVVPNAGRYRTLADLGITLKDDGTVDFNQDKFNAAFATDPDAVSKLFTQADNGIGSLVDKSMTQLVDPVSGVLTIENQTLDSKNQQIQTRIDNLDKIIADKKTRLEQQFANMESVLAGLQSQQAALSSLTGISAPKASSSSSSKSN